MISTSGIKRVGGVLVTSLVVCAGTVAAAPSLASADAPGCATNQEVLSLERGWTEAQALRVLDMRGTRSDRDDPWPFSDYDLCRLGDQARAILAGTGGDHLYAFRAVTWNVHHGTDVDILAPIMERLISDGVSVFLMQEAHGSDITAMSVDAGLRTYNDGPDRDESRRQWRVAWDPGVWEVVSTRLFTGTQQYATKQGPTVTAQVEVTLRHILSGKTILFGSYHTPSGVQTVAKPTNRIAALEEMAGHWRELADSTDTVVLGGDDNVDEGRAFSERFSFMDDAATGLLQVQAPEGTHGRKGRRIDDFHTKGMLSDGGEVREGGGDHKAFSTMFVFRVSS